MIILTKKNEKKLLGTLEFDLAKYANTGKENYQESIKFGDKVKMVLEYDLYIKFIGEASQTSKSVSKKDTVQKK